MTDYHVRAVQKHSKVGDNVCRHVLECIALDIGRDDKPAVTGYRSIAERVRINKNNVSRYINDLVASGELIKTKVGKYQCYNLNQKLIPYQNEVVEHRSDDYKTSTVDNALVTKNELDSQLANLQFHIDDRLSSLSSQLSSLSYSLSELSLNRSLTQEDKELREEKEESKKESKKKERESAHDNVDKTEEVLIPDKLNTPEFLEIWKDFIAHRIELSKLNKKKKPMTTIAKKRCLSMLVKEHKKYGMDRVIFELEVAIQKNWDKPYFTNDNYFKMRNKTQSTTGTKKTDSYGYELVGVDKYIT